MKTVSRRGVPCRILWLLIGALVGGLGEAPGFCADADRDGMDDGYELLFGLDPANPADAAFDGDNDGLTALDESILGTDPFAADTDRDGLADGEDPAPLSQAYMGWGDPFFTWGDAYSYPGPAWWLGARKDGGDWTSNGWEVAASAPEGVGRLVIDLDRTTLGGDAVLAVELFDRAGASLFVDLLDADEFGAASDLYGNLLRGSNEAVSVTIPIPLSAYSNAASIALRRGTGGITVYRSAVAPPVGLAVDTSGVGAAPIGAVTAVVSAGLVADGGTVIGAADPIGSAAGGPGYTLSAGAAAAAAGRGHAPTNRYASSAARAVIHVDARTGSDRADGLRAAKTGTSGPKRTIGAGLSAARSGAAVVIHGGHYAESLNLAGRAASVRLDGNVVLGRGRGGSAVAGMVTNLAASALMAGTNGVMQVNE